VADETVGAVCLLAEPNRSRPTVGIDCRWG
jgi:hypothetical protein